MAQQVLLVLLLLLGRCCLLSPLRCYLLLQQLLHSELLPLLLLPR